MPKEFKVFDGWYVHDVVSYLYGSMDYTYDFLSLNEVDIDDDLSGLTVYYEEVELLSFKINNNTIQSDNKFYTVKDGQGILDISLQLYGSVEYVYTLLEDNNLSINDSLRNGMLLKYTLQKKYLPTFIRNNKIVFNTEKYTNSETGSGSAGAFDNGFNISFDI